MKIKLKELVEVADRVDSNNIIHPGSLSRLITKELPVKTAYHLGKLFNKIKSELQQYYLHRDNLIKKYGQEKDGSHLIEQDDKEAMEKFTTDNEELLGVEVELTYEPIALEALGDVKLSPVDMSNLERFFKEE